MFPFVPPPPVRYAPPDAEHVPLHSKSSCKNMARASGGCKYYAPSKLGGGGGHKRKRSKKEVAFSYYDRRTFSKNVHNASNFSFDLGMERPVYAICAFEKIDASRQTHDATVLSYLL